jgi:transposase
MLGEINKNKQQEFFTPLFLDRLIPEDHILKRVDRILELGWIRDEVRHLYSETMGRPSIDPEAAIRLMLAGFFQGIIYDRELMREAQVNLAIRWFGGFGVEDDLPDHSTLSKLRTRWGIELFQKIFTSTVQQCIKAGLVDLETVHVDATLMRANASWESITEKYVEKVIKANDEVEEAEEKPCGKNVKKKKRRKGVKKGKARKVKVSRTDPDSSVTKSSRFDKPQPRYKVNTAVDNKSGVVVDVFVTTGKTAEASVLVEQIDRIEKVTGVRPGKVTADTSYSTGENYEELEKREIKPVIPTRKLPRRGAKFPVMRFKYDAKHNLVKCPAGKKLVQRGRKYDKGYTYRADPCDCRKCRFRNECFSSKVKAREIVIVDGYPSLLRARRRNAESPVSQSEEYRRHKWLVEGRHGEAKTRHGQARASRRGIVQVAIQVFLINAVMNLKRLASPLIKGSGDLPLHFVRSSYYLAVLVLLRTFKSHFKLSLPAYSN